MRYIVAVDPGRDKTGLALVGQNKDCPAMAIVQTVSIEEELKSFYYTYKKAYPIEAFICGDGTHHKDFLPLLASLAFLWQIPLALVKEHYSTQEGKGRYWACHPPSSWKRCLPTSWLTVPKPVDDYTAWIIGERYFMKEYIVWEKEGNALLTL